MAPGRARDERKEQQWRRRIDDWRASGLCVRDFCARHGLASASFYNWRRVLARRAAEQPAAFVPVQVVADAVPAQASALEVVLVDGRAVRVAPGFDEATLRRLLAVLEGEGSC
jgi:transposase